MTDPLLGLRGARQSAAGSVLRTASGVFLLVLLPPVLVRTLAAPAYSTWVLCAELAGYLVLLESGLAVAIAASTAGRTPDVAAAMARRYSWLSRLLAAAAVAGAAVLFVFLPVILQNAPKDVADAGRTVVLLMAIPSVLLVGTASVTGYYYGRQAVLPMGVLVFAGRGAAAVLVGVIAIGGGSLIDMALAWAVVASAPYVLVNLSFMLSVRRAGGSDELFELPQSDRVVASCLAYSAWAIAGFLVVGLNSTLVARYDFDSLGTYAVAGSLPLLLQAATSSLVAPMVAWVGQSLRNSETQLVRQRLDEASRAVACGLAMALTLGVTLSPIIMRLLADRSDRLAVHVLTLLLLAAAIRLPLIVLSTAVVASGEHIRLTWLPLVEAFATLGAGVILGARFGAVGVASGVVVGAVIGVVVTALSVFPRLRLLPAPGRREMVSAIAWSSVPCALAAAAAVTRSHLGGGGRQLLLGFFQVLLVVLVWAVCAARLRQMRIVMVTNR